MKQSFKTLITLARDKRISDNHFREMFLKLGEVEHMRESVDDLIRAFALEALYDTERDRYVH